jgi:hypothetical protein
LTEVGKYWINAVKVESLQGGGNFDEWLYSSNSFANFILVIFQSFA